MANASCFAKRTPMDSHVRRRESETNFPSSSSEVGMLVETRPELDSLNKRIEFEL